MSGLRRSPAALESSPLPAARGVVEQLALDAGSQRARWSLPAIRLSVVMPIRRQLVLPGRPSLDRGMQPVLVD